MPRGFLRADRGRIEEGLAADLVVFDPEWVGREDEEFCRDFPAGASRYVHRASGVDLVVVNGEVALEDGEYVSRDAGKVVGGVLA